MHPGRIHPRHRTIRGRTEARLAPNARPEADEPQRGRGKAPPCAPPSTRPLAERGPLHSRVATVVPEHQVVLAEKRRACRHAPQEPPARRRKRPVRSVRNARSSGTCSSTSRDRIRSKVPVGSVLVSSMPSGSPAEKTLSPSSSSAISQPTTSLDAGSRRINWRPNQVSPQPASRTRTGPPRPMALLICLLKNQARDSSQGWRFWTRLFASTRSTQDLLDLKK